MISKLFSFIINISNTRYTCKKNKIKIKSYTLKNKNNTIKKKFLIQFEVIF